MQELVKHGSNYNERTKKKKKKKKGQKKVSFLSLPMFDNNVFLRFCTLNKIPVWTRHLVSYRLKCVCLHSHTLQWNLRTTRLLYTQICLQQITKNKSKQQQQQRKCADENILTTSHVIKHSFYPLKATLLSVAPRSMFKFLGQHPGQWTITVETVSGTPFHCNNRTKQQQQQQQKHSGNLDTCGQ